MSPPPTPVVNLPWFVGYRRLRPTPSSAGPRSRLTGPGFRTTGASCEIPGTSPGCDVFSVHLPGFFVPDTAGGRTRASSLSTTTPGRGKSPPRSSPITSAKTGPSRDPDFRLHCRSRSRGPSGHERDADAAKFPSVWMSTALGDYPPPGRRRNRTNVSQPAWFPARTEVHFTHRVSTPLNVLARPDETPRTRHRFCPASPLGSATIPLCRLVAARARVRARTLGKLAAPVSLCPEPRRNRGR